MTLNKFSSLDLEAHLKGRRKYKRNLRRSGELKLKIKGFLFETEQIIRHFCSNSFASLHGTARNEWLGVLFE